MPTIDHAAAELPHAQAIATETPTKTGPEVISVDEFWSRLKRQLVSSSHHLAFRCPMCGTVQSMASLVRAGATTDQAEKAIGFSCEGRWTNAGPWWPSDKDRSAAAQQRRKQRGCDWTLGGLFTVHRLAVQTADGETHPRFEIATADEAQFLAASFPKVSA